MGVSEKAQANNAPGDDTKGCWIVERAAINVTGDFQEERTL